MNEWTLQTPYLGYVLAIVAALTVAAFAKNGKRSIVSTALLPPAVVGLIVLLVWLGSLGIDAYIEKQGFADVFIDMQGMVEPGVTVDGEAIPEEEWGALFEQYRPYLFLKLISAHSCGVFVKNAAWYILTALALGLLLAALRAKGRLRRCKGVFALVLSLLFLFCVADHFLCLTQGVLNSSSEGTEEAVYRTKDGVTVFGGYGQASREYAEPFTSGEQAFDAWTFTARKPVPVYEAPSRRAETLGQLETTSAYAVGYIRPTNRPGWRYIWSAEQENLAGGYVRTGDLLASFGHGQKKGLYGLMFRKFLMANDGYWYELRPGREVPTALMRSCYPVECIILLAAALVLAMAWRRERFGTMSFKAFIL